MLQGQQRDAPAHSARWRGAERRRGMLLVGNYIRPKSDRTRGSRVANKDSISVMKRLLAALLLLSPALPGQAQKELLKNSKVTVSQVEIPANATVADKH